MTEQSCLLIELNEGVLWLTLNRPAARNALNITLTRALAAELERIDIDDAVRVAVITGSDPAFCAGLDLKDFAAPDSPRSEVGAMINSVPLVRKPIIAAVNGPCVTGGFELALGCDFIIASERAKFADTHTKIGALAGGGMTARLPHRVGYTWAKQITYTSIPVDAATALRIGIANEVKPHEELLLICAFHRSSDRDSRHSAHRDRQASLSRRRTFHPCRRAATRARSTREAQGQGDVAWQKP